MCLGHVTHPPAALVRMAARAEDEVTRAMAAAKKVDAAAPSAAARVWSDGGIRGAKLKQPPSRLERTALGLGNLIAEK